VAHAFTQATDIVGGVEITVTATAPVDVVEIRRRAEGVKQGAPYCMIAKEPPGWLDDDCFGEDVGTSHVMCPIMARGAVVEVKEVDGGAVFTMRPPGPQITDLRREVKRRTMNISTLAR
jgi:hypothetical protein